jgi:hypothetical protein
VRVRKLERARANRGSCRSAAETKPRACAIVRLLSACGQFGTNIRHPRALTEAVQSHETSWQALRTYLENRVAGGPHAADFAIVEGVWSGMRKQLRKRGIKISSQVLWGVRETHPVCLLPPTLAREPQWLSPLRLVLTQVNLRDSLRELESGAPSSRNSNQDSARPRLSSL